MKKQDVETVTTILKSLEGMPENLIDVVNGKLTELIESSDKAKEEFMLEQIELSRKSSAFWESINEHKPGKIRSMLKNMFKK